MFVLLLIAVINLGEENKVLVLWDYGNLGIKDSNDVQAFTSIYNEQINKFQRKILVVDLKK